jgi:hypothetical protein
MLVRSRSDRSWALFHPFPLTIMPLPFPLALVTLSPPWFTPLGSPHPYCLPRVYHVSPPPPFINMLFVCRIPLYSLISLI